MTIEELEASGAINPNWSALYREAQRFPADDECDKRHYSARYPVVVRRPPWRQARTHRRSIPNK